MRKHKRRCPFHLSMLFDFPERVAARPLRIIHGRAYETHARRGSRVPIYRIIWSRKRPSPRLKSGIVRSDLPRPIIRLWLMDGSERLTSNRSQAYFQSAGRLIDQNHPHPLRIFYPLPSTNRSELDLFRATV